MKWPIDERDMPLKLKTRPTSSSKIYMPSWPLFLAMIISMFSSFASSSFFSVWLKLLYYV